MGKILTIVIVLIVTLGAGIFYYYSNSADAPSVPIDEFPTDEEHDDLIRLRTPRAGEEIRSPLVVTGEARGYWFFEASFPMYLVDWDGKIIAQGIAQAQDEWMTEDFVPFEATLTFEMPLYEERGALILRKDNPSGLPEHDDALEVQIFYKK